MNAPTPAWRRTGLTITDTDGSQWEPASTKEMLQMMGVMAAGLAIFIYAAASIIIWSVS
jgi:hypothetical protein